MNFDIQSKFLEFKNQIEIKTNFYGIRSVNADYPKNFMWFPEYDVGWLPANPNGVYDEKYFDRYSSYRETSIGQKINQFRVSFVRKVCVDFPHKSMIDFGCGSGQFIEAFDSIKSGVDCYGYDINPKSKDWLNERTKYIDYFSSGFGWDCVTCWDSFEHLPCFWDLLEKIRIGGFLFLTVPIFQTAQHALRSKHFRPDEHYWYFTRFGLLMMMDLSGFDFVCESNEEEKIGRIDVMSFAFKRVR